MSGLNVIVCDDHRMMREALSAYLAAQPRVGSVNAASDADEAIRQARQGGDVLVLDLRLAGDESGLEVLEALQNLAVAIPVLVMAAPGDLDITARALSLGALGYCPKSASPSELYDAVVDVAAGRAYIPDGVLEPLLRKLVAETRAGEQARATLARMTPRELEVLRMLAQGVGRFEIARRLGLSGNTVRTHLRHVMEKLGVTTQLSAAARGREVFETARSAAATGDDDALAPIIDLTPLAPAHPVCR